MKRSIKPLRKTGKLAKKAPLKSTRGLKPFVKKKDNPEKMWKMFLEIWEERKRADGKNYSELSGEWLGPSPYSWYFDHLLEKGNDNYKHLKYEKRNILLVTANEHNDKGGPNEHPDYQYFIKKAKEELL